jgi:HSP20 family protein
MNLIPRNNPFNFDGLLDQFFGQASPLPENNLGFFTPRVDIQEGKNTFKITADLPGVKKEDLNITLNQGMLSIEAETQQENKEEHDGKIIHQERRYGKFMRRFNIGSDVQEQDIEANFKDGVLTLTAPRHELPQPETRRIEVH